MLGPVNYWLPVLIQQTMVLTRHPVRNTLDGADVSCREVEPGGSWVLSDERESITTVARYTFCPTCGCSASTGTISDGAHITSTPLAIGCMAAAKKTSPGAQGFLIRSTSALLGSRSRKSVIDPRCRSKSRECPHLRPANVLRTRTHRQAAPLLRTRGPDRPTCVRSAMRRPRVWPGRRARLSWWWSPEARSTGSAHVSAAPET